MMKNLIYILAVVFLMMFGYGLATVKTLATAMCLGMALFTIYGGRKFAQQDAEHDRMQRIKQNFLLTSEHMMELHGCEASQSCAYNPGTGLQVSD
jgi:hypothetical protein